MLLETEQITQIQERFSTMKTKEDLVKLLNYVQSIIYPRNKPILIRSLNYYSNPSLSASLRYKTHTVTKKNGKERIIHSPIAGLKLIQKCLNVIFSTYFSPSPSTIGFVQGRNITNNAQYHIGKHYIYNTDLTDFFPSIQLHRIKKMLMLPPFNLNGEREPLAFLVANLCCVNGVLPQGAPTSPILSNIVCQKLDRRLIGIAKRFGVAYSRYADDITFSAYKNVFSEEFKEELERVIVGQGFRINQEKTHLQKGDFKQVVTGLVVNEKINVSQKFIREIRSMLHNWEKEGLDKAIETFSIKNKNANFLDVLKGRISFLKLVRGGNDKLYQKYFQQFQKLQGIPKQIAKTEINISAASAKTGLILKKEESHRQVPHKPFDVVKFLQLFRNSEGLKYLIHQFDKTDEIFNREKILIKAKEEFEVAKSQYAIPSSLYERVRYFAFVNDKEKKATDNFPIFWSSNKVIEWCERNSYSHPLQNPALATEIELFRDSIRVRGNLENIIKKHLSLCLGEKFYVVDFQYERLEYADFYTDVRSFEAGLRGIFTSLLQQVLLLNRKEEKITIRFSRVSEGNHRKRHIIITHHNSFCNKEARVIELLGGDLDNTRKSFYGICDWYIETTFSDGAFRLNVLYDVSLQPNKGQKESISPTNDFTHIISFYAL